MIYPRRGAVLVAGLVLAVYAWLYYATPLSILPSGPEGVPRRALFLTFLLRPDDLVQQWLGSPAAPAFLDRLPVLLLAGGVFALATGLGWVAIRLLKADRGLSRLERFVFSAGVGLNLVSTYVLAMGLLGGMNRWLLFYLPVAITLAAIVWLYRQAVSSEVPRQDSQVPSDGCQTATKLPSANVRKKRGNREEEPVLLSSRWLWLIAPFVVVIFLGGMMPPIEFDVREYHLQVPKEFYQQGRITFLPHNVYGNMAMGTEMLSLLAMVIAGDWWLGALAGKALIAAFAPLTALALFAAGRRYFSTTAGVAAAVLFISVPWVIQVSMLGLVDVAAGCYLLLALYSLLLYARPPRPDTGGDEAWPRLLLASYLAGAAVATKYPAALFVAAPLTAAVGWMQFRRRRWTAWKPLAVFLLAIGMGCGLWFAKNWVLTGNPTYPLLYEVFGGKTRTAEKNRQWTQAHQPTGFSIGALVGDLGRVGLTSPWLSPLLVPMAGLALFRRRHRWMALILAAYFGYFIATWWLCTHRIDRFWIPAIPLLALLAGIAADYGTTRAWRRLLIAVLLVSTCTNLALAASPLIGDNRFFMPLARLQNDPLRVMPWHRFFNAEVPNGCILMVGEAQVFDLKPRVMYDTCFDSSIFEQVVKNHSIEEIRDWLKSRGVTHVFVHWGEIARYRATYGYTDFVQPEVFQRLVDAGVLEPLPVIEGNAGRAYRIR
ncbi:MAG: hypothetical protein GXY83_04420 [Rhodopirellula sp.]|nr:hypothetical protein [Rhodopirellula sp.]